MEGTCTCQYVIIHHLSFKSDHHELRPYVRTHIPTYIHSYVSSASNFLRSRNPHKRLIFTRDTQHIPKLFDLSFDVDYFYLIHRILRNKHIHSSLHPPSFPSLPSSYLIHLSIYRLLTSKPPCNSPSNPMPPAYSCGLGSSAFQPPFVAVPWAGMGTCEAPFCWPGTAAVAPLAPGAVRTSWRKR